MAVTINASTSAGLIQTADTTGNLSLQSNGTTIAALTSTGLAVTGAGSFSTTLGVTGAATLAALSATTGTFSSNVAVTGTGKVSTGFAVGNATPGAGGVAFPATAVAVADANTLDDYEEGSWTPVDSSGASLSFTVGSAIYIKIGRFVLVQFYFNFPVTASGASNLIGGLPFTVASSNNYCYGVGRLGTPSAIGTMQANAGGTDIQIYTSSNGIYTNSQLSNGNVLASVSYITT